MNKKDTLAVDYDGVIHDHKNPVEGKRMGKPIEGARQALLHLSGKYNVVIFSVWGGDPTAINEWLRFYDMPRLHVTNIKPQAIAYIDDKAIRFENWKDTLKLL